MKKIKNFVLDKIIGKGQFGEGKNLQIIQIFKLFLVYQGVNLTNHELVAIKVVKKQMLQAPKLKQLFTQEVVLTVQLMGLLNNENVVKLIDYIESSASCYVVMEYCDGGDLEKLLRKIKNFSELDGLEHFKEILNGFKALHEKNIMHRDFKSANVFIKDNIFKIGDFGFAKQVEGIANTILGTPLFMAPELLENKRYTNKTDIWAIGIVFYSILFGSLPFDGKSEAQLIQITKKNDIDFNRHGIKISQNTQNLIKRMLDPNPNTRIEWFDLFNHPAFSEEEQANDENLSNEMISKLMRSIPNVNVKSINLKSQANFYKENKQFQQLQEVNIEQQLDKIQPMEDVSEQSQQTTQAQDDDSTLQQQIEQEKLKRTIDNEIKQVVKRYNHERSLISQLGKLLKKLYETQTDHISLIYQFLLAKKYYLLNQELVVKLRGKENQFNLDFFNNFVDTGYFQKVLKQIEEEFVNYELYFEEFLKTALVITNSDELKKKYKNFFDKVNPYLNKENSESFHIEIKELLYDYYMKLYEKAQLLENSQDASSKQLYLLCLLFLDVVLSPEIFPFQFEHMDKEISIFDFNKYNEFVGNLDIAIIKRMLDYKIEIAFSSLE